MTTLNGLELEDDEKLILKMNPKFAVMRRLDSEVIENDIEVGFSKARFEVKKFERNKLEADIEYENADGKKAKIEKGIEKEKEDEIMEAMERQVFNPKEKTFDYSKRRTTDLKENGFIHLPKAISPRLESELELIRKIVMEEFHKYRNEIDAKQSQQIRKKKGNNQEWSNLTKKEKSGLKRLKKRIKRGEIVILKSDKSGRMIAMKKDEYLKMGLKSNEADKKLNRKEIKDIETEINDHTRMLCKVFNAGEHHDHLSRILGSKIVHSEATAPKYFLLKDHKKEEAWRPVVSGCSSNTLGLSNLLSDVVESVANATEDPFEVISSEDLLSRVENFNKKLEELRLEKGTDWDWRQDFMLIGSDVVSLFPSLSAEKTAEAVRNQILKSKMTWQNIDYDWIRLYLHLNEKLVDNIDKIKHLLPCKKKNRRGVESGMHSRECMKRHLLLNSESSCWTWPKVELKESDKKELLATTISVAIKFFFGHFTYTFGGQDYLQLAGGPIGARLTMAVARLVLQEWSEHFKDILDKAKITELLRGIYVDDGRNVISKLRSNMRFNVEKKVFDIDKKWSKDDEKNGISVEERTVLELNKIMNCINDDLKFTTELETDFDNGRLPTLSFEMWSEKAGIKHSYYEKPMRSQILTHKRSSQAEKSKYSILVNELNRRFEVLDDSISISEKVNIIDHFTKQLVNSGYGHQQCKEIIISSLKGVTKKLEKRKSTGKRYRSGVDSLDDRLKKRLMEATTWYKDYQNENGEIEAPDMNFNTWKKYRVRTRANMKKRKRSGQIEKKSGEKGEKEIYQSVMFIEYTAHSELAQRLRERLKKIEEVGQFKFKIVERSGEKIVDQLHKSNVWETEDCMRKECLICSDEFDEKKKKGKCKKRCINYEIYCITCHEIEKEKEIEKIEKNEGKELTVESEEKKKRKREDHNEKKMEKNEKERNNDYKVLYIGETKKSGYERGCEHLDDLKSLKENSHLLKHLIEVHPNLKVDELKVGMRIRKTFKSALERQIGEAIAIKVSQERGYTLMNSKSEYNRCKIPRIVIDTENETYKKLKIQEENDRIKKTSIRMMKKRKKSNEKEMKLSLQEICDENRSKWRLREIEKKKEKLETEQKEKESYERMKRKNRAEMKKKKLIEKIREKT